MGEDDYAGRFAIEHAHYTEDIPFWRAAAARTGSPVLDLGAASGRVALPLARDGAEVWAVDRSLAMLDQLRMRLGDEPSDVRSRVRTIEADLRELRLGRRFPLVIVAMNTLQVLLRPEEREAAFHAVRDHLAPGGEFVFDVALPDVADIEETLGVVRPGRGYLTPDGTRTMVHSAWYESYDRATATLAFAARIEERAAGEPGVDRTRRHVVHLYSRDEIARLLDVAGLRAHDAWGDFRGAPLDGDSERQVYRCMAGHEVTR